MKLGIYGDLAVGVARGNADTWLNRADYCMDMAVGAPPDPFSPTGQNWNLPPLNPTVLKQTGYEKFVRLLRENMRLYGVLRIDHVIAFVPSVVGCGRDGGLWRVCALQRGCDVCHPSFGKPAELMRGHRRGFGDSTRPSAVFAELLSGVFL